VAGDVSGSSFSITGVIAGVVGLSPFFAPRGTLAQTWKPSPVLIFLGAQRFIRKAKAERQNEALGRESWPAARRIAFVEFVKRSSQSTLPARLFASQRGAANSGGFPMSLGDGCATASSKRLARVTEQLAISAKGLSC